tara:strand:+ start:1117 stop:1728 length:612 start_codon:yes stop_codon:yes gene_type:complete
MSSEVKANKISPATGTALQISDSGDTTTIPSGATLAIASGATIANSGTQTGFGMFSSYAIIADQKTTGTNGGTFTVGAWRERDLQTELSDPDGIVSIASNQFTLAAGTYFISWKCPAYSVGNHQSRLYNVTDAAEVAVGMSCRDGTYPVTIVATGSARTTITGSKTFSIEHQSQYTVATYGFGYNFGLSSKEQYTMVEIYKEA